MWNRDSASTFSTWSDCHHLPCSRCRKPREPTSAGRTNSQFTIAAHSTVDAGGEEGSSVPRVKAKNAIGLGNGMPTFDIMKFCPLGVARSNMPGVKLCLQLSYLFVRKRQGLSRSERLTF
jgi:hypothetical protein